MHETIHITTFIACLPDYNRQLMGKDIATLNSRELQSLENQLETNLQAIRQKKVINQRFHAALVIGIIIFVSNPPLIYLVGSNFE